MIQLRGYQTEAIGAVAAAYRRGIRRALIGLPTGTGKTVVFSSITQGAVAKQRRAVILAHRDELIEQAADKLCQVAPELERSIGVIKAARHEADHPVTLASVQSLNPRRLARIRDAYGPRPYDVVVVDEAHHAAADSYVRALTAFGCFDEFAPLSVGVTATPQRSDGRDLGEVWEEIVYHRDLLSMMRQGYLCNLRGIAVKLAAFETERLHTRAGDFIDSEAGEALHDADAPRHVAAAWLANAAGRQTIVFTPTVALAGEMRDEFRARGVAAEMVSGETPMDERRGILARFNRGEVTVVANAQVLTEGFDEPSVACIVIARPTKSQPLYVQMVGRGTRIHPGKDDCLIIDVAGATDRHDLTTLPKLFGLGDESSGAGTGEEVSVSQTVNVMETVEKQAREGRLIAQQVELFNRKNLAWQLARPGVWCLDLGDETVILDVDSQNRWQAAVYPRSGGVTVIAEETTLHMGMGIAEEYARRAPSFAQTLIDKSAGWRQRQPSKKQLDALKAWRLPVHDGMTRGEANDAITQAVALARRKEQAR